MFRRVAVVGCAAVADRRFVVVWVEGEVVFEGAGRRHGFGCGEGGSV